VQDEFSMLTVCSAANTLRYAVTLTFDPLIFKRLLRIGSDVVKFYTKF